MSAFDEAALKKKNWWNYTLLKIDLENKLVSQLWQYMMIHEVVNNWKSRL